MAEPSAAAAVANDTDYWRHRARAEGFTVNVPAGAHFTGGGAAANPWDDQRRLVGGNSLIRVIDLAADRQEFVVLVPKDLNDLRDLAFDGATFILPRAPRTVDETAEIIRRFDTRYRADPNKQTRVSVLDREKYLTDRN